MIGNSLEAQFAGILSSTDKPEIRIRRHRDGKYSVRVYAKNRDKTAHGTGDTIAESVEQATANRGRL
jgi:hypothetical protein